MLSWSSLCDGHRAFEGPGGDRPPQLRRGTKVLFAVGFVALSGGVALAQQIVEFDIPTANSKPLGIVAGPDGAIWFTEEADNKIGRLTTDGAFTEFRIPTPDSRPARIARGPDGALWFTESSGNKIGQITTSGDITEFAIPTANSVPTGITAGADGNVWFAEQGGQKIGRITSDGVITEFSVPPQGPFPSFPLSMATGPDGNVWFSEGFTGRVGRITPDGFITLFPVEPRCCAWLGEITAGPDGNLWFIETWDNKIGRITPTGEITYFRGLGPGISNGGPTEAYAIAAGADGALWFTEVASNRIGRITTEGVISEIAIPTADSDPGIIARGPDGALWFTERARNRIGRVSLGEQFPQACRITPETLCLNGERFRVRVDWRVPPQGTSGVGMATALTADTGYFWFFTANNIELVVKVVDGREFNGYFWVFYGALSDVEYSVTVTDMMTGSMKTYTNPQGRVASVADTAAFRESGPLRSLEPSPPPDRAAPAIGFTHPGSDAKFNAFLLPTANSLPTLAIPTSPAQCTPGPQNLCLNAARFRVDVNWRVPSQGTSGVGTAMPLTEDTGYFWFFSSNNVELVIKVVDGRAFNGYFWVFYGALSDVEYTITVSDTLTGISKTYTNPEGQLASVADTAAF